MLSCQLFNTLLALRDKDQEEAASGRNVDLGNIYRDVWNEDGKKREKEKLGKGRRL